MGMSKLRLGLVFLVSGVVSIVAYLAVAETTVGQISELYGLGFCFCFLGVLSLLGHAMGLAPEREG